MVWKKRRGFLVSLAAGLALLALSPIPARANDLSSAILTPGCNTYTVCATAEFGTCPPLSVDYTFTLTTSSGSVGPVTGSFPLSPVSPDPDNDSDWAGCVTTTYPGGPLTGSFTYTINPGSGVQLKVGSAGGPPPIPECTPGPYPKPIKSPLALVDGGTGSLNCPVTNECPLTQGFWKNHPQDWPVTSLTLGTKTYTQAQLLSIFDTPVKGDASIELAHQLIAAKLNIANGSNPAPISSTISDADGDIDSSTIPAGVKASSTLGQDMTGDASELDGFNSSKPNGCTGPS